MNIRIRNNIIVGIEWAIIAFVIAVLAFEYINDRSLWMDEAMLQYGIATQSISEILKGLEYSQQAPLGYLLLQKLVHVSLGHETYAIRLISLISVVSAILLFRLVVSMHGELARLGVFILLSLNPFVVYYAVEAKQYGLELLASVYLMYVVQKLFDRSATMHWAHCIGSSLSVLLSYGSIFIIASAFVIVLYYLLIGRKEALWRWLTVSLPVIVFIVYYIWYIRGSMSHIVSNAKILGYHSNYFSPLPLITTEWYSWLAMIVQQVFENLLYVPVGIGLAVIAAFSVRTRVTHRDCFLIILLGSVVAASYFHLYTLKMPRMMLFAIPSILWWLAFRADQFERYAGAFMKMAMVGLLMFYGARTLNSRLIKGPVEKENVFAAISVINSSRMLSKDTVFVSPGAEPTVRYYHEVLQQVNWVPKYLYEFNDEIASNVLKNGAVLLYVDKEDWESIDKYERWLYKEYTNTFVFLVH